MLIICHFTLVKGPVNPNPLTFLFFHVVFFCVRIVLTESCDNFWYQCGHIFFVCVWYTIVHRFDGIFQTQNPFHIFNIIPYKLSVPFFLCVLYYMCYQYAHKNSSISVSIRIRIRNFLLPNTLVRIWLTTLVTSLN